MNADGAEALKLGDYVAAQCAIQRAQAAKDLFARVEAAAKEWLRLTGGKSARRP